MGKCKKDNEACMQYFCLRKICLIEQMELDRLSTDCFREWIEMNRQCTAA